MAKSSVINPLVLLLLCVIGGGLCLKCYQCDSSTGDTKCHWNRNFTQLLVEDCPAQSPPWLGEMGCARVNVTSDYYTHPLRTTFPFTPISLSLRSVGGRRRELVRLPWVYAKNQL